MKMTLTQALVLKMRWAEQPVLTAGGVIGYLINRLIM
jgi:hypothetical protein